jgi:hypothetical protein
MNETELLERLSLSADWTREFVTESNQIDPQPGDSSASIYDWHYEALLYVLSMAADDRYALPREIHRLLLREHPQAGRLRNQSARIACNGVVDPARVPALMFRWNNNVHETIDALRTDDNSVDSDLKRADVWGLHCELMNIRPFELYNGKVGRLLMVNHALLVGVEPWIVPADLGRDDYFGVIRNHPSFIWAVDPPLEEIQL